ncbi:MAG: GspH/FimT family pseudopilin [Natronospirillum sp.]
MRKLTDIQRRGIIMLASVHPALFIEQQLPLSDTGFMTNPRIRSSSQRPRQSRVRQSGMNIIELMVVVAIVGILSLIAAPNMRVVVENSQVRGTTNDLAGALAMARSEALTQGGMLLRARVVGGNLSFNNGWCVVAVGSNCEAGAPVRVYEPSNGVAITVPGGETQIRFDGRGALVLAPGAVTPIFSLQHDNCAVPETAERARTVSLGRTGRATVGRNNCV